MLEPRPAVTSMDSAVELPRPGGEREGLGRERADGAEVDDVARQLGGEEFGDVRADLGHAAAAGDAEVLDPRDFRGKSHAPRAVDAPRHHRLDQRAELFILHRALVLGEPRAIGAVDQGLVLELALAALVADGAVRGWLMRGNSMAPSRLLHQRGGRLDVHVGHHRHGAGRHGLWRFLNLHEAHPAVARDGQALVVAEPGDVHASLLARLQHGDALRHLMLLSVDEHGDGLAAHAPGAARCRRERRLGRRRARRQRSGSEIEPRGRGGGGKGQKNEPLTVCRCEQTLGAWGR